MARLRVDGPVVGVLIWGAAAPLVGLGWWCRLGGSEGLLGAVSVCGSGWFGSLLLVAVGVVRFCSVSFGVVCVLSLCVLLVNFEYYRSPESRFKRSVLLS